MLLAILALGFQSMFGGGPTHAGSYPEAGLSHFQSVKWHFHTDAMVESSPIMVGKSIVIGSNDGYLYRLDIDSGSLIWKHRIGQEVSATAAFAGRTVVIENSRGDVFGLSVSTGKQRWVQRANVPLAFPKDKYTIPGVTYSPWTSSPTIVGEVAFVAGLDGRVRALELGTGKVLWQYETGSAIVGTFAVDQGVACVGTMGGELYAFDAETGAVKWKFKAKGNPEFASGALQGSPTIKNNTVVIGSRDYSVYALDLKTGSPLWTYKYPGSWVVTTPAIADGKVYIGSSDATDVECLSLDKGEKLWEKKMDGNVFSSLVLTKEAIYAATWQGNVYAITGDKHDLNFVMGADGRINSTPLVKDGVLYFGCESGEVFAVNLSDKG